MEFKPGDRVEILDCEDAFADKKRSKKFKGRKGIVQFVDDIGDLNIFVKVDNRGFLYFADKHLKLISRKESSFDNPIPVMSDEEIFSMLLPKFSQKNHISVDDPDINDIQRMVAIAYRSGFGRGTKGRPFEIKGKTLESKSKGHWEKIKRNESVKKYTRVRRVKELSCHVYNDDNFYPPIGHETKVTSDGSEFWLEMNWESAEWSGFESICCNGFQDYFEKWVEE